MPTASSRPLAVRPASLLERGRKLDLPPLATNDSHYVTADQAESHAALLCVQAGKTLDDPNRFKLAGDGYYLKSTEEMRHCWDKEISVAISNTLLIAERVESYESVFAEVGDLVRWARSQKIAVGPGRGSATGSLVAYVLQITAAVDAVTSLKRHAAAGQFDLFGGLGDEPAPLESSPLAHLKIGDEEWPRRQKLGFEREMLGLYVSAHPLDGTERILRKHAPRTMAELIDDAPKESEIVLAGMISAVDRRVNKKGESWAIVTIEDLDASMEVLFFARSYMEMQGDLNPDAAVAVKGRVNWREDRMSVFASGVVPLDIADAQANPGLIPPLVLKADALRLDTATVTELKSALVAHSGDTPLTLVLCYQDRETPLAIEGFSVTVSSALLGELKGIPGIAVAS